MKKWILIFLSLLLLMLPLAGCSGSQEPAESTQETTAPTDAPTEPAGPLSDGKTLRVLAIGNSFSNNTTEYLYQIAKAEGVEEIVLGRLYIGGCTLGMHVNNAVSDEPAYIYYKNTTGKWEKHENSTLLQGLKDEPWDIITMQQGSAYSGRPESYTGLVQPLINYVNHNKTNPDAKIVWHMTWAYQEGSPQSGFVHYKQDQMTMYNAIIDTLKKEILPITDFAAVIPAGTALQNLRTSHIGDNVTRDTYHLNAMGMVTAGYCWYAAFTGKTLEDIKLTEIESVITLTEEDRAAIAAAVNSAMANPFEVTNIGS